MYEYRHLAKRRQVQNYNFPILCLTILVIIIIKKKMVLVVFLIHRWFAFRFTNFNQRKNIYIFPLYTFSQIHLAFIWCFSIIIIFSHNVFVYKWSLSLVLYRDQHEHSSSNKVCIIDFKVKVKSWILSS